MKNVLYLFGIILLLSFNSCATRVKARATAKKVTVVKVAPRGHKVVYVKGAKYYTWNGKRYQKTRRGYILVR
ncbi:hypothetical protein [Pseudofulvibacter geojedonensis]|uniref:Lipoprotein n=1 Tax=Pseudofulvibacter geojedonensis TaxID=1123758 RepID=A0ABW3HY58_9FLAO